MREAGAIACRIVGVAKRIGVRSCSIVQVGTGESTQRVVAIRRFAARLINHLGTKIVLRIGVGVARERFGRTSRSRLPDDGEDLPIVVVARVERDAIGIAGLGAMIVGIVAERGGCTARLRQ